MRTYKLSPLWLTIDVDCFFDPVETPRCDFSERGTKND